LEEKLGVTVFPKPILISFLVEAEKENKKKKNRRGELSRIEL
jgi:hypothetical protein